MIIFLFFCANVWTSYEYTPQHKQASELVVRKLFAEAECLISNIKQDDLEDLLIDHIEKDMDSMGICMREEEAELNLKKIDRVAVNG